MTDLLTVAVDTDEQQIETTIDAFRAENIPTQTIVLADKDKTIVSVGFAHTDGTDPQARFDEVDDRVRSVLQKAGISAEIAGHGMSSAESFS